MDALPGLVDDPPRKKPNRGIFLVLQAKLAAGVRQSRGHDVDDLLLENFAVEKWTNRHGCNPPTCQRMHVMRVSCVGLFRKLDLVGLPPRFRPRCSVRGFLPIVFRQPAIVGDKLGDRALIGHAIEPVGLLAVEG